MAISDVQLDTGINVGKAQVFKPLDVQELFDAQQKRKAVDELAKANKLKQDESNKAKLRAEIGAYGALKSHREGLDKMAKEILDMTEKNPDNPEIATKIYNYGVAGKSAQDVKSSYDNLQKTLYKDSDHLIYGDDELNSAIADASNVDSPNYNPTLDPNSPQFDLVASTQYIGSKIQNVKSIPKDKGYTLFIQETAKNMGDNTVNSMDKNLTEFDSKETIQKNKNAGWEALKLNNRVDNGVRQMMEDDPSLTRDDAMLKLKNIYDASFDEMTGIKLDKETQRAEWKPSPGGGGGMESKIYKVLPSVTSIKTADNVSVPEEVVINTIVSGEPKEIKVRVVDTDERGKPVIKQVSGSVSRWRYIPGKGYVPYLNVPNIDSQGKKTGGHKELQVIDDDLNSFDNEVGIKPWDVINGGTGYKTHVTSRKGDVNKKKTSPTKKVIKTKIQSTVNPKKFKVIYTDGTSEIITEK